jgi:hypothetical protein
MHCSSGQCTPALQTPKGVEGMRLSQGKTVVIILGGHLAPARVSTGAPLLRITSGAWHDL